MQRANVVASHQKSLSDPGASPQAYPPGAPITSTTSQGPDAAPAAAATEWIDHRGGSFLHSHFLHGAPPSLMGGGGGSGGGSVASAITTDVFWLIVFSVVANALIITMCFINAAYIYRKRYAGTPSSSWRFLPLLVFPSSFFPCYRNQPPAPPSPSAARANLAPPPVPVPDNGIIRWETPPSSSSSCCAPSSSSSSAARPAALPVGHHHPAPQPHHCQKSAGAAAAVIPAMGRSLQGDLDMQSMLLSSASVERLFSSTRGTVPPPPLREHHRLHGGAAAAAAPRRDLFENIFL